MVYVENSAGWFLIIPSLQLYAELNASASNVLPAEVSGENATQVPLDSSPREAEYQVLSGEDLNGRRALKYLVRQILDSDPTASSRDSFVWVDEELSIPIRSESTRTDAGKTFRFVTELRDISTQVDDKSFEVPAGYQKVEHKSLLQRIAQTAH